MPVVVAIFFFALFSAYITITVPQKDAQKTAIVADTSAVNMLAYRAALSAYLVSNPTFAGNIPDSSITLPTGMVRDANWTNVVYAQTLYVFEATPSNLQTLLDAIYLKLDKSYLVGKNSGGNFVNAKGYTTGALPVTAPAIPSGSIVIIGI